MTTKTYKTVTFKGGVHPARDGKDLSRSAAIQEAPLLDEYQVIVQQNIGAPPKLLVKKGDEVKKGQMIAEAGGFVSVPLHSPTSGKVKNIDRIPGPMGVPTDAVIITADGKDEWGELMPPLDWKNTDGATLKKRICDAGIVGMGGAAFPAHVKLSPPPDKKIDYLILNGAECEPYLTADHRLMLEETEKVLEGAAILGHALGVKNVFIGIETNKEDAIHALLDKCDAYGVGVVGLKVQYPQGAEKQLIYAVTGRKVPAGKLPMDAGCVVQNVGTAAAVTDAVKEGKPLIERITTVTGEPIKNPSNWRFRLGTPVSRAIELAGGITQEPGKIILGGPMMGFAQKSMDVTVMKNTSGILLLEKSDVIQYQSTACIRCGRCLSACPMNLLPGSLSAAIESEKFDLAAKMNVMDCIECGSCAYICPAHRPLVQHFRRAKAEIRNRSKK
ncbi:electron transport complex subunit RsxC [Lentisphaerota bacterium ZTH]|nr:electron transport complex subunit RsxC [Lentisphaerota bacterium]WET05179.1 electron transport complex subunit RsxC [Lentisphaerota bacterium ZTH]